MKRNAAVILAAALILTACGGTADGQTGSAAESAVSSAQSASESTAESSASPEETADTESAAGNADSAADSAVSSAEPDPAAEAAAKAAAEEIVSAASEDVVSYLTEDAFENNDLVLSSGDEILSAAEASFYIAYQHYNASYYYTANGQKIDINGDAGNGQTIGEYMVTYAKDQAGRYLAGIRRAKELGLTLDVENQASLDNFLTDNYKSAGETRWYSEISAEMIKEEDFDEEEKEAWILEKGETALLHDMLSMGTTPEAYLQYAEKYYYIMALQNHLFGEGGEMAISEEELDSKVDAYIEENGVLWGRCILFSSVNATEEEAAETKKTMESVYEELQGLSGQELTDRFTALQTSYDKSGYTAGEIQMYTNTDSLVPGYYEGLKALGEGELGVTDQTAYGWFILLREPDQPSLVRDNVKAEAVNTAFQTYLENCEAEYQIDSDTVFEGLDYNLYFTHLTEVQDAVSTVDQVYSANPAGSSNTGAAEGSADEAAAESDSSAAGDAENAEESTAGDAESSTEG